MRSWMDYPLSCGHSENIGWTHPERNENGNDFADSFVFVSVVWQFCFILVFHNTKHRKIPADIGKTELRLLPLFPAQCAGLPPL